MNADAFRHFYNYHFAENRKILDHVASLTFEQFTQKADYSRGSIREQLVHLFDAEEMWFSELRGVQPADPLPDTVEIDDRDAIRAFLDQVEKNMGRIKKYQAPIITCCRSGARSGVAKNQIRAAGIECVNGGPWQTVQEAVIERKNKPNS